MRSICIYCGSNPGRRAAYAHNAEELAKALISRNLQLVYGGASVGIMGLIANTMLEMGGQVVGVIPDALVRKEVAHANLTELHVTQSMHERKTLMAELADGFIAMPGGIGTLEEIFEVWTWGQLGFHNKPCGLLNVEGYFDSLIKFLDNTVTEEFVQQPHRSMLLVDSNPTALLDKFASYHPPTIQKWVEKVKT